MTLISTAQFVDLESLYKVTRNTWDWLTVSIYPAVALILTQQQ